MKWTDWILPWRAKARIEALESSLAIEKERTSPLTTKVYELDEALCATKKKLTSALEEKHACATLLTSTRASETEWHDLAVKLDLEKNEVVSLNRSLCDQLEHAKDDIEAWKNKADSERKQREEIENSISSMKTQVNEAQAIAAKAIQLQESLEHEVREHRESKQVVAGLTKWIKAAHRLDAPSPQGTIRRILQSARFRSKATASVLLLSIVTAFSQAPIWRNSFTTNQAPPVIGTNVGISNTASSFMWKFYGGSDPNRVAVLSDITGGSATNAIGNLNGYGTNTTFFGPLIWGSTNIMDEIATMIKRSNGFGTNLSIKGTFNVDSNLWVTNDDGPWTRVGINTNHPNATLHINSMYPFTSFLITSNEWQPALKPTLIVTGSCVGIGIFKPIVPLEVSGNSIISGWMRITNGLRVAGGMAVIQDFTNSGTAYLTNLPTGGNNQTALAINTNAVSGVAVVQIAAGTNGSTGRAPTNQWVILYTNAIYGKGFAVETNGAVTASSFTGVTPGGGAFIADLNGNGTNTTLYGVGSSNIAYWTDKEWTLTNTGYGTRMRWQAPLGSLKTDGAFSAGGGATIGDGLVVTNNVVVFGAVYAQGFTNTSAGAYFTDLTASKVAVFGPGSYLTNSTIDAADLAKIGATNFDSLFVTNTLVASNIVATNFTVDTFTSSTLQLSNALEVRFGGTGTNTNVLGSFFIGNGTNPVVFLDTNTYANWLSNQIVTTGISGGTNFPGIFVTNNAEMFGLIVRSNTGFMSESLLKGSDKIGHMGIWNSNGTAHFGFTTNGTPGGYYIPLSMDFGHAEFNQPLYVRQGMEMSNVLTYWQMYPTNRWFFRQVPVGGLYIRPQVATNDGAGGYGGLMDIALRTDVTNAPIIYNPQFVGYVGIGTNSPQAPLHIWGSNTTGPYLLQIGGYYDTNYLAIKNDGTVRMRNSLQCGGLSSDSTVTAVSIVRAGTAYGFEWSSSSRMLNPTNGALKFGDGGSLYNLSSNRGATILFEPVQALPFPSASVGVMTNGQWGIGNTNGTLAFATSTNGTNLYIVAGLNPTNGLWVSNHVTVLGTNYATAFVGDGSLLTGLSSSGTNFNGIYVTNNAVALSNVFVGGRTHPTNGLLFPPLPSGTSPYATNDLFTVGSGATSNALWAAYNSNGTFFIECASGPSKRSWVFKTNGSLVLQAPDSGSALTVNGGLASVSDINQTAGNSILNGRWELRSNTNGFLKGTASGGSSTTVGTGLTLGFDPVTALPWSVYSLGILTNKQWCLANTNGEMRFFTGTNGTSLTDSTSRRSVDVFGINPSNVWVQTQGITNNTPGTLGGQPLACYASMMFGTTNYGQVFGATAYTNIVGYNVWNTNWFVCNTNTGYATNLFAGYYRCTINVSMLGQNGATYEGCMLTNDVDSELIGFKHTHDTPARLRSASGMGIIYLPANTGCSFAMKSDTPGSIQIHRGSMTVGTP